MRPYLGRSVFDQALHRRALPLLERDEPTPYIEPIKLEELDDAPFPICGELPEELLSIMEKPIRPGELRLYNLEHALQPAKVYRANALRERSRVEHHSGVPNPFRRLKGSQRLGVLVRYNVKRRWEKMGI